MVENICYYEIYMDVKSSEYMVIQRIHIRMTLQYEHEMNVFDPLMTKKLTEIGNKTLYGL